ncbi:UNVERIFIED_CONTAM: hypothetical protein K2H54_061566 [Gekko kuhli]
MATSAGELEDRSAPVSKSKLKMALQTMENSILEKLAAIMKPTYEQMEKLQKDVNENKVVANTALNVGRSNQKEIQQLQLMDDVLAERTLKTEITLRQQNLKIRGWPEKIKTKGRTHCITTKEEGFAVLRDINLATPMDHEKSSYERKHRSPSPHGQEQREQREDLT